jgi:hypothetical protein
MFSLLVPPVGLEPTRLAANDPKSLMSTNFNKEAFCSQDRTRTHIVELPSFNCLSIASNQFRHLTMFEGEKPSVLK